jgi:hypothetical protein
VSDAKPKGPRATAGPKPVRPKKLFERPWPWIVIAGLIVGAVFALGTSLLQSAHDAGGNSDDAFFAIAIVGDRGRALMLLVGLLVPRGAAASRSTRPGTMMVWLKATSGSGSRRSASSYARLAPPSPRITTGKDHARDPGRPGAVGIADIVYQTHPKRVLIGGNLSKIRTRVRVSRDQVELEKTMAGGIGRAAKR